MMKAVVILLFLVIGLSHAYPPYLFKKIKEFNEKQQHMLERAKVFETIIAKKTDGKSDESAVTEEFEDRLSVLEKRITAILNYLMREKTADIVLKHDARDTITEMKGKVKQSDSLINDLEDQVENSLKDFDAKIIKVNKTAHLTVNVKGVIFIGSFGSTCSAEAGDCNNAHSECRDGKCQCDMGFSFDNELNECVDTCREYGCTFQSARRRIIREHNDKILENVTLTECKQSCIGENDFLCRSLDYFPRWETCYLSQKTKVGVPDASWEYNSAGTHFQRDCLGIKELSLCNENKP